MENKNPLLVSEEDIRLLQAWPLELRAIFDPAADRELARRIEEDHRRPPADDDSEPPF